MRSWLLLLVLTPVLGAQSFLQPGDVGVVTTAGFYRVHPGGGLPAPALSAAAFGLASLGAPTIEWLPGTDSFLVATGANLFRVTVASATSASITDVSPTLSPTASFFDLDLHPGSGALFLLDHGSTDAALRFTPPFTLGMLPDLAVPVANSARCLAVDSVEYPPSVIAGDGQQITRWTYDGVASAVGFVASASGLDDDPQGPKGTRLCHKGENKVGMMTSNPGLMVDLNAMATCNQVAQAPTDVEYDPGSFFTYVFAEDGLNPACPLSAVGGNHVVALPPAIGPVAPQIITEPGGSGIGGKSGDIALVIAPYAFASPYGTGCASSGGKPTTLLPDDDLPGLGNPDFDLLVSHAPAGAPTFLLVGLAPQQVPLPAGCELLVLLLTNFGIGTASALGEAPFSAAIPASAPAGLDVFVQAALLDGGQIVLTHGLQLRLEQP